MRDFLRDHFDVPDRDFRVRLSGRRPDRLPYGVCTLRVNSTRIVQEIYGAIQEYTGMDRPEWLD